MLKRILFIVLWVLITGALMFSMAFVSREQGGALCRKLTINIHADDENFFIDEADIRQMIFDRGDSIVNQPVFAIDINSIEKLLGTNPWVADAQVYLTLSGEMKVEVIQRKPLVRIVNREGESFYIDTEGRLMLWSPKFTPRVLVANGNLAETYGRWYHWKVEEIEANDSLRKLTWLDDICRLAEIISYDEFWDAQTEQIYVNSRNEIELVPRVGHHTIILGDANDAHGKLRKLKIFYREGLNHTGWNEYDTLNLRFAGQVVCSRAAAPVAEDNKTIKEKTKTGEQGKKDGTQEKEQEIHSLKEEKRQEHPDPAGTPVSKKKNTTGQNESKAKKNESGNRDTVKQERPDTPSQKNQQSKNKKKKKSQNKPAENGNNL